MASVATNTRVKSVSEFLQSFLLSELAFIIELTKSKLVFQNYIARGLCCLLTESHVLVKGVFCMKFYAFCANPLLSVNKYKVPDLFKYTIIKYEYFLTNNLPPSGAKYSKICFVYYFIKLKSLFRGH